MSNLNRSNFSDDEESQNELILHLINNLFDIFSLIKLEKLENLLDDDKTIKNLIFEMYLIFI
jgi:hypothetical protein